MEKEILIPTKDKKVLAKDFNTSRITVWSALKFKTNSGLADMIRAAALERGGKIYDGSKK